VQKQHFFVRTAAHGCVCTVHCQNNYVGIKLYHSVYKFGEGIPTPGFKTLFPTWINNHLPTQWDEFQREAVAGCIAVFGPDSLK